MENDIKTYIEAQTEKLAAMIAAGFATTATKEEVSDLRTEMSTRFDKLGERFDRIEKSHGYRLETLERDGAELKA